MIFKAGLLLSAYCLMLFCKFQANAFPAIDADLTTYKLTDYDENRIQEIIRSKGNTEEKVKILKDMQERGVDTVGIIINQTHKALGEIEELLSNSEVAMRGLRRSSQNIEILEYNFTRNFFEKFNNAQLDLIDARKDLLKLAADTINLCRNIEAGYDEWEDKHKEILIKDRFKQLRRLIKRSKTTLTSAKEKYNSLIEAWVEIDADVEVFYQKLTTAVDKSTSDYKRIAKKLRTEAYVTSTLVTVGMIIADIFGCLGLCSLAVTTSVWAVTATNIELKVASYKAELERMKNEVEEAKSRLKKLENKSGTTVDLLEEELKLVIKWESAAVNVENVIDDFSFEQLREIMAFQNIFKNSITRLKDAAQEFKDFATGSPFIG